MIAIRRLVVQDDQGNCVEGNDVRGHFRVLESGVEAWLNTHCPIVVTGLFFWFDGEAEPHHIDNPDIDTIHSVVDYIHANVRHGLMVSA